MLWLPKWRTLFGLSSNKAVSKMVKLWNNFKTLFCYKSAFSPRCDRADTCATKMDFEKAGLTCKDKIVADKLLKNLIWSKIFLFTGTKLVCRYSSFDWNAKCDICGGEKYFYLFVLAGKFGGKSPAQDRSIWNRAKTSRNFWCDGDTS